MSDSPVIDTHTHVVARDTTRYPLNPRVLSPNEWYLEDPASAEDLRDAMDESGVDRAVLVQGVGAYTYDNAYAVDMAARYPERFVSACCIDVLVPDAPKTLEYWVRERGAAGIRLFALAREGPSWLTQESTFSVWQRAEELGAHVIVTILPHQLHELQRVLEIFPRTPISLDHCAFALSDPEARAKLEALARFDTLHLKLTTHGLDEAIAEEGSAQPLARRLADVFGAERLMWGSDFCQIHDRTYPQLVDLARDAFAALAETERREILGGTAMRLWPGLRR